jgi:uncharacterized protein
MTGPTGSPREVFEHLQRAWLGEVSDLTDGLWAEDVIVETPFAPPGRPQRWQGREEFSAFAAATRAALPVRLEEVRNVVIHQTTDPEVLVVEYELAGTVTTSGRHASASFIGVLRARNGQIVHWREYQNTLAMAEALGRLPARLDGTTDHHPDPATPAAGA